jgi:hypothetical protein
MVVSRHQNAGQNDSSSTANKSFGSVAKLKYLGTTATSQNCVHEKIGSRLNSGNACCQSDESLLSSGLLSQNLKIKTHKTYFT